jgi:hypothetical protein
LKNALDFAPADQFAGLARRFASALVYCSRSISVRRRSILPFL